MKVDTEGNVYCGGAGGIWIMHPKGKKLGRIRWLTRFWSGMDSNSGSRPRRGLGPQAHEKLGLRSAYAAVDAADLKSCSCEMSRLV